MFLLRSDIQVFDQVIADESLRTPLQSNLTGR
jgi:hypothetical protein